MKIELKFNTVYYLESINDIIDNLNNIIDSIKII